MPRIKRIDIGDTVYHVINRANARIEIFNTDEDYDLFERVLEEAKERSSMRILSYCVMPNHWHLVLYPRQDGDLQMFMGWGIKLKLDMELGTGEFNTFRTH